MRLYVWPQVRQAAQHTGKGTTARLNEALMVVRHCAVHPSHALMCDPAFCGQKSGPSACILTHWMSHSERWFQSKCHRKRPRPPLHGRVAHYCSNVAYESRWAVCPAKFFHFCLCHRRSHRLHKLVCCQDTLSVCTATVLTTGNSDTLA
jgi:hypothetical protein